MLTTKEIFGDTTLDWGQKHPQRRLVEIWKVDAEYLIWACDLNPAKRRQPADSMPAPLVRRMVQIAHELERGDVASALKAFEQFQIWRNLSQLGIGLESLPKPSPEECRAALSSCSILAGHSDLDGLVSMALAISEGGAVGGKAAAKKRETIDSLRILGYHYQKLLFYTQALNCAANDRLIVIDFAAHPEATMTFDHHSTCLSFWEDGTPIPKGVYDTSMPSCPRLLAHYCQFAVDESILRGTDRVDGAQYKKLEEATSLEDPYTSFEYCLHTDVSEISRKEAVLTLAVHGLDLNSVLEQESWQLRRKLVRAQMAEQRQYLSTSSLHVYNSSDVAAIDLRTAPHSGTKFRYLPFELDSVRDRPYLITFRGGRQPNVVNIGVGRNPFYPMPQYFIDRPLDVGALMKQIGAGGGRKEVGAVTVGAAQLDEAFRTIISAIESGTTFLKG